MDDLYRAEAECCRLEALWQEASHAAARYRREYESMVLQLRQAVRDKAEAAAERTVCETERTLFDTGEG